MCINRTLYIDQLQFAFNHFNDELFGGQLPEVVITANAKKGQSRSFRMEQVDYCRFDCS